MKNSASFRYPRLSGACAVHGLTIVELVVVIMVSIVVSLAALSLYQLSIRHYVRQDALLEQMQNMRVAMYAVARDVRMAGSGMAALGDEVKTIQIHTPDGWFHGPGQLTGGARAIFVKKGNHDSGLPATDESDSLTVFRTDAESASPIGVLARTFEPGVDDIFDIAEPSNPGSIRNGDIVVLVHGHRAIVLEAEVLGEPPFFRFKVGKRFKPLSSLEGLTFPSGSYVFNLRDVTLVTYSVDPFTNHLLANYYDRAASSGPDNSVVVAANITMLRVACFYDIDVVKSGSGWSQWDEAALDSIAVPRSIKAVQLAITSESRLSGQQPSVERTLTEIIYLRNY